MYITGFVPSITCWNLSTKRSRQTRPLSSLQSQNKKKDSMSPDDLDNKSDEDLLKILDKNYSYPDAMRVKARAILRAKEQADAQQKHDETISVSRSANKLSIIAIVIAAISLAVAVVALYISNKDAKTEQGQSKTELHKQQKVISQPTNTTNAK
jgi:hypothetical protein